MIMGFTMRFLPGECTYRVYTWAERGLGFAVIAPAT